jgi:hypothetical protein
MVNAPKVISVARYLSQISNPRCGGRELPELEAPFSPSKGLRPVSSMMRLRSSSMKS